MWIMLKTKIPVEVSPPAMSIHWSGASAEDVGNLHRQKVLSGQLPGVKRTSSQALEQEYKGDLIDMGDKFADWFGYEPKEEGSRWILFDSVPVKVWPHEYTAIASPESLRMYLTGDTVEHNTMSHVPMYSREALFCDPITLKPTNAFNLFPEFDSNIFDAALVDGANELTAFYTSLGRFPRTLWYAIVRPYGEYFGLSVTDMYPIFRKKDPVYEQIKQGWKEDEAK